MENWDVTKKKLKKTFELSDFKAAVVFVQLIAFEAEKMNHHPQITIMYNKIDLELSTHDAGDVVTDKDEKLAKKIDKVFQNYFE